LYSLFESSVHAERVGATAQLRQRSSRFCSWQAAVDETATRGVESGGGRLFALHCRVDGAIACQPWTTMRMVEQYDDVTSRQWHMAYGCRCMPRIAAAVALRRRHDADQSQTDNLLTQNSNKKHKKSLIKLPIMVII
jgi:hypothetical protein